MGNLVTRGQVFEPARAPTPRCHGASLVALPNGLACAWFAGPFEGSPETSIWWSRQRDGAWRAPERAADLGPEPHWNPVLLRGRRGLVLFFKVGLYPKRWRTYVCERALADVAAWSAPRELVQGDVGGRGPVRSRILVEGGRWLAPASLEEDAGWSAFVDRSEDEGQSWRRGAAVPFDRQRFSGSGMIQPAIWRAEDGALIMLARSLEGVLLRSESRDDGASWSAARATAIPNNNSGFDALRRSDGELWVCGNPVTDPQGPRAPLVLAPSEDEGRSWRMDRALVVEAGEGELSYPSLVETGDGLACAYTRRRRSIGVVRFRRLSPSGLQ